MSKNKKRGFNRREFLKAGALTTAYFGATGIGLQASQKPEAVVLDPTPNAKAKNIILMVSDGMSMGTLSMADLFLRRRDGRPSNWIKLYEEQKVNRGLMDMSSANSPVTDSAAASTSWGSGYRVNNGSINMGPGDKAYEPIMKLFKRYGKATGCVTTARVTHATPAGFTANVGWRNNEDRIAEQLVDRKYDLMLGGGKRHFDPNHRKDERNLEIDALEAGFDFIHRKDELLALNVSSPKPLIGCFSETHLPFNIDHIHNQDFQKNIPTLSEMTDVALKKLSANPNGFLLQVEGARVDHAAHSNDIAGLIYDQIAFDEAIKTVMQFAESRNDTMVIITTDHGNSNPGLSSASGDLGRDYFDKTQKFKHSFEWIFDNIHSRSWLNQIREVVEAATSIPIDRSEARALRRAMKGRYSPIYHRSSNRRAALGAIIANHTSINWISQHHTSDYVELAAFGPGKELIGPFTLNTELHEIMCKVAGLK